MGNLSGKPVTHLYLNSSGFNQSNWLIKCERPKLYSWNYLNMSVAILHRKSPPHFSLTLSILSLCILETFTTSITKALRTTSLWKTFPTTSRRRWSCSTTSWITWKNISWKPAPTSISRRGTSSRESRHSKLGSELREPSSCTWRTEPFRQIFVLPL